MNAIIFDFDGVIADTEALHLAGFRHVLADLDITITDEVYYNKYVGYSDQDGFPAILHDNSQTFTPDDLNIWIDAKTRFVQQCMHQTVKEIPGAVSFIQRARDEKLPLAVCSGALHEEINTVSDTIGITGCFDIIVSAEDVSRGKPDPEGYYLARRLLAEHCKCVIDPKRCVVFEDTPQGIEAARGAGMKVCGLATTFPRGKLEEADMVIDNFLNLRLESVDRLVR